MDPSAWAVASVFLVVALLTILIAWGKLQPIFAFVIASGVAALLLGLPLASIPATIERGIGDLLGSLVVIVCVGAVFGKLIADSGAAQVIATRLIGLSGPWRMPLALAMTGFIVGIPLFYNVGFVLLVPLIFSLVSISGRPAVVLGIPLLSGLSIAHGFLPPHPAPVALVTQFQADMGLTLLYGLIVGLPTLLIAGPLFALTLRGMPSPPVRMFEGVSHPAGDLPGVVNSFGTALLPVGLLALTTALSSLPGQSDTLPPWLVLVANPSLVMLVAYAVALWTLGFAQGRPLATLMKGAESAIRDIAPILLIIGGAGALRQVFVDAGLSQQLADAFQAVSVPPLVLGWLIAAIIRVCLGSATVAGVTAAGIVAPITGSSGVEPNLMVLAIGAGSLMCSHVNDAGFWMFKEYFNLSIADTLRSWTVMETLVGVFGLVFVLLLSYWV